MVDQIFDHTRSQNAAEQTDPWSKLGESMALGLIQLMKPRLVTAVKEQIAYYVEKGEFGQPKSDSESPKVSLKKMVNSIASEKNKFQGIGYVQKQDKVAVLGLKFVYEEYNSPLVLDIKMRDRGGYWQIAELSNFSNFLQKLDELGRKQISLREATGIPSGQNHSK